MATYGYTLQDVRKRAEFKLRDDRSSTMVNNWVNDVVQNITSEVFFDELYHEDYSSLYITGDGTNHLFDLQEDFAEFAWVYNYTRKHTLDEASPRELMEDFPNMLDLNVQSPMGYAKAGRMGSTGTNNVPLFQIKFDSIPTSGERVYYAYFRLHEKLVNDTDVIILPQNLLSTIVDGVLLEADSWNDSDQFAVHRDRFLDKMNQLKRNQNRRPNRRRTMGKSSGMGGRPPRPTFPSNYPDVWGQG
jgi:hypothetical protein